MTLNNVVAGLIAVLCTVALPAAAQTETVTFTGTIVAGYGMDTIGLFGGGDLSNDTFSLTYIFNSDNGFQTGVGTPLDGRYGGGVFGTTGPIVSDTLTINGRSFSLFAGWNATLYVVGNGYAYSPPAGLAQVIDTSGNRLIGIFEDANWDSVGSLAAAQGDSSNSDTYNAIYGKLVYDGESITLDAETVSFNGAPVPEPTSLRLLTGLVGIAAVVRRNRRGSVSLINFPRLGQ